jgi:hypothetical protein
MPYSYPASVYIDRLQVSQGNQSLHLLLRPPPVVAGLFEDYLVSVFGRKGRHDDTILNDHHEIAFMYMMTFTTRFMLNIDIVIRASACAWDTVPYEAAAIGDASKKREASLQAL